MPASTALAPCIGVFDSGVGGLSVLRALRRAMPAARLLYVADSRYAPYGERDEAFVIERSRRIASFLRSQGAQLVVIACNTATAAAVQTLRTDDPHWPVVGVEPGVKPAVAASRNGRIGVMATTATLASAKFRRLLGAHSAAAQVHTQPCPGLARAIEAGDLDAPELLALIETYCAPLRAAEVDTVVLGCTHYPFVAHHIQAALGAQVQLIDTAEAVARHTLVLGSRLVPTRAAAQHSPTCLWTTGDAQRLREIAQRWLDFECDVSALEETPPDAGESTSVRVRRLHAPRDVDRLEQ